MPNTQRGLGQRTDLVLILCFLTTDWDLVQRALPVKVGNPLPNAQNRNKARRGGQRGAWSEQSQVAEGAQMEDVRLKARTDVGCYRGKHFAKDSRFSRKVLGTRCVEPAAWTAARLAEVRLASFPTVLSR